MIQCTVSKKALSVFLAHLNWKLKWASLIACSLRRLFTFSSSSPEEHLANFNQTWHKVFLDEGDSYLFKWRATPFYWEKIMKNILMKFKNLLLQNCWANLNQTWHKASLGEENSSLFKGRAIPFSKSKKYLFSFPYQRYDIDSY